MSSATGMKLLLTAPLGIVRPTLSSLARSRTTSTRPKATLSRPTRCAFYTSRWYSGLQTDPPLQIINRLIWLLCETNAVSLSLSIIIELDGKEPANVRHWQESIELEKV